ncbi:MAG: DUF1492 domain-containing protein [Clostridiales bacterium]|nr:DUF1492 domain-containing protein [Clostridiales bacterium]
MTAKEFLRQYQDNLVEIRNIDKEIERLEAHAMSVSQPTDKERVQSSATQDSADTIAEIADMQVEVEALRDEALRKLKEISDVIRIVESKECRQVLHMRYVENSKWDEVATKMNYSRRWIMALHRQALERVSTIIEKSSF